MSFDEIFDLKSWSVFSFFIIETTVRTDLDLDSYIVYVASRENESGRELFLQRDILGEI